MDIYNPFELLPLVQDYRNGNSNRKRYIRQYIKQIKKFMYNAGSIPVNFDYYFWFDSYLGLSGIERILFVYNSLYPIQISACYGEVNITEPYIYKRFRSNQGSPYYFLVMPNDMLNDLNCDYRTISMRLKNIVIPIIDNTPKHIHEFIIRKYYIHTNLEGEFVSRIEDNFDINELINLIEHRNLSEEQFDLIERVLNE